MLGTTGRFSDGSVPARRGDIRRVLVERRRALVAEIQDRVRDVREEGTSAHHHSTHPEDAIEAEDDLAFAVIQMKTEILERIDEAIRRCDEGHYGYCGECGDIIAPPRLRALPFAVRCRYCEERREHEQRRERVRSPRVPPGFGSRC